MASGSSWVGSTAGGLVDDESASGTSGAADRSLLGGGGQVADDRVDGYIQAVRDLAETWRKTVLRGVLPAEKYDLALAWRESIHKVSLRVRTCRVRTATGSLAEQRPRQHNLKNRG
jgi:hypothetical protein